MPSLPEAGSSKDIVAHRIDSNTTKGDDINWVVPIALRKWVRSCVKYPISNHLIYTKLSSQFRGFVAKIDSIEIPKYIQSAMNDPKWKVVVMEEMATLVGNDTSGYCETASKQEGSWM